MSTDNKPEDQVAEAGAGELTDSELDKAAGGIMVIAVSHEVKSAGVNAVLADGSVRSISAGITPS